MVEVNIKPYDSIGTQFVPTQYLKDGQTDFDLRNIQVGKPDNHWRQLRSDEIETLVLNGNSADDWDNIRVHSQFNPQLVKNCEFYGLVRIGAMVKACMAYHDLTVPVGLSNSRIISCDIGDNIAIHNVRYLGHYIIGDNVMMLNCDEVHTTNYAKFGSGIVKIGESESVRIWMDLANETGGRAVPPFEGITTADAWIWAKYRGDKKLMARLLEITQDQFDSRRGFYGTIGSHCVIKNCRIIKDVKIGPSAYVKGANKLKNLTINSSVESPSQIGEGVELVNGIIGYGCKIFYGCKAVRFVMGDCANLKYGARLIHSFLGDNSTISCCEVLNDLIFPAHEQHHNNSFLTAAIVKGQSNVAAGATLGSNHNSRANDGEVLAGRGFWPGLCVTIKHYCRFASFTLLAKGDYPAEMDIPLPFSLVSDNQGKNCLQVMPAYWWMYNMYALARNSWKFQKRDKRKDPRQHIEFDALAPDTAEEMFAARDLLAKWTAKAAGLTGSDAELIAAGVGLFTNEPEKCDALEVFGEKMENSRRKVCILKARQAWLAYGQMLEYYAVKNLAEFQLTADGGNAVSFDKLTELLQTDCDRCNQWVNLGGQLVRNCDMATLLGDINSGRLNSWDEIHQRYDQLNSKYQIHKLQHCLKTLETLNGNKALSQSDWNAILDSAAATQEFVCDQVYSSRKKDYRNSFRAMTFDSDAEKQAVVGDIESNDFVLQVRQETEQFNENINKLKC